MRNSERDGWSSPRWFPGRPRLMPCFVRSSKPQVVLTFGTEKEYEIECRPNTLKLEAISTVPKSQLKPSSLNFPLFSVSLLLGFPMAVVQILHFRFPSCACVPPASHAHPAPTRGPHGGQLGTQHRGHTQVGGCEETLSHAGGKEASEERGRRMA